MPWAAEASWRPAAQPGLAIDRTKGSSPQAAAPSRVVGGQEQWEIEPASLVCGPHAGPAFAGLRRAQVGVQGVAQGVTVAADRVNADTGSAAEAAARPNGHPVHADIPPHRRATRSGPTPRGAPKRLAAGTRPRPGFRRWAPPVVAPAAKPCAQVGSATPETRRRAGLQPVVGAPKSQGKIPNARPAEAPSNDPLRVTGAPRQEPWPWFGRGPACCGRPCRGRVFRA